MTQAYRGSTGRLLKWARQETRPGDQTAFIVRGNLSLSVVAGSTTIERLFRTAVDRATFNFSSGGPALRSPVASGGNGVRGFSGMARRFPLISAGLRHRKTRLLEQAPLPARPGW